MAALIRSTPLALFPSMLGMFGLVLAWRRAFTMLGAPDLALWVPLIALPVFALAMLAYMGKLTCRFSAVFEDLKMPPARAGLGAISMGIMLAAAVVVPLSHGLAMVLWWAGVLLHAGVIVIVTLVLIREGKGTKGIGPALMLPYVGIVVAPIAAVPLGLGPLSGILLLVALVPFAVILVFSLKNYSPEMPAPLRPTLAILLAPFVVTGVSAYGLGWHGLFYALILGGAVLLLWVLARLKWMIAAGFSPVWGAFTFPAAASANVLVILAGRGGVSALIIAALAVLIVVTAFILWIHMRTLKLWPSGMLAQKSGAATA